MAAGAHRVAVDWLAAHASLPFDPALVDGAATGPVTGSLLNGDDDDDDDDVAGAGMGQQLISQLIMATCDVGDAGCPASLNDLHGRVEQVVQSVGETAVTYRLVSHVSYALGDGSDATTTLPTRHKKVTVTVSAPGLSPAVRPAPVHLSELYPCGTACAW